GRAGSKCGWRFLPPASNGRGFLPDSWHRARERGQQIAAPKGVPAASWTLACLGHWAANDYINECITEHGRLFVMSVETALDPPPVRLTERAAHRIAEILREEAGASSLRVAVTGGGCSGFQYDFCLDDSRADDDLVLLRDG